MRTLVAICCLALLAACGAGPAGDVSTSTVIPLEQGTPTTPDTTAGTVPDDTAEDATVTTLPPEKQPIPVTTVPPAAGGAVHATLVAAAAADLAASLGVAADTIEVVATENVTWPNGALGCPQPGNSYTQALVPGFRIGLRVDGTTYWYHGAEGGEPFLCRSPSFGGGDRDS